MRLTTGQNVISKLWLLGGLFIFGFLLLEWSKLRLQDEAYAGHQSATDKSDPFEDKYFKRILQSFKNRTETDTMKHVPTFLLIKRNHETKYWKESFRHVNANECPLPCKLTYNRAEANTVDAVVLFMRDIKDKKFVYDLLPKRNSRQPWIMLSFEAPLLANSYYRSDYNEFNGMFNRTMTFRKDSDIIVAHGFIVSKIDAELLPSNWHIAPNYNVSTSLNNSAKEVVIATLISNCDSKSGRGEYIKELQKYIKVDVYGGCGTLKCGHSMYVIHPYRPNTEKCLRKLGTSYMFYLAFENSICKDYGTEKIYNLLYYPLVPIVLGSANYKELLPPHSYINAADYAPSDLAKYIKFLVANPEEYIKYFKWREAYVPSTIGGERLMCDLCTRLHDPAFYHHNVIEDFRTWFLLDSKCDRKWTVNNTYNLSYEYSFPE